MCHPRHVLGEKHELFMMYAIQNLSKQIFLANAEQMLTWPKRLDLGNSPKLQKLSQAAILPTQR